MWVLDLASQRFHNTSSGDFNNMFIKARDSETKEGEGGRIGESLGGTALAF